MKFDDFDLSHSFRAQQ